MQLLKIYNVLESHFGKQNWWPVSDGNALEATYKARKKLTPEQKLEISFGAILTQNTSWKNVAKVILNLKKARMLSIEKISNCNEIKLLQIIKSAGYFNQKSVYLKAFCKFLKQNYNSKISKFFEQTQEKLRDELLSIKGIGKETADSIILYAAQKPQFVIDAYTKRIFERLGLIENKQTLKKILNNYDLLKNFFESNLPQNAELYNEFHALLVQHAQVYCLKHNPLCQKCPLLNSCDYGNKYTIIKNNTKFA